MLACRMRVQDPLELWVLPCASLIVFVSACKRAELFGHQTWTKHINNWIQLDTISTYQITSIHISDQAWPGSCCCEHTQFPVPSAVVLIGQNIYSRSPESYVSYEFRRYRKLLPLTLTSCCPCSLQSLGVKSITQPLICATHGNRGDMRRWRKMLDNLWQIENIKL